MTIQEIHTYLEALEIPHLKKELLQFKNDPRQGVQKLVQKYEKKYKEYFLEIERLNQLNSYENSCYNRGIEVIAGLDEVGRGPLAGPVVSAAVILPRNTKIWGINDSKQLSEKKREELFTKIMELALDVGIGIVSPEDIDVMNILNATKESMKKALEKLKLTPEYLLIDAITLKGITIPQEPIIQGDGKSISIAAASIIAKVTRDHMMKQYHQLYPEYGFAKHKGYGTKEHIQTILEQGICPIHRKTFTKNILFEEREIG